MEALMGDVKEAVGEPLHLIGEPPASIIKDVYEKQPVSAPLALFLCAREPWSPADVLPVVCV